MAFENNQQDAFNLRNDTESLKQWQSELDKATTSIGAAEVAAEEALAALKFKNLSALQDARIAKLEQLITLEDEGIKELAKVRLTLSNKQFELRKKEIQKEFQLAKKSAEELLKVKGKKVQPTTQKPASTKDIITASKTNSSNTGGANPGGPNKSVIKADTFDAKPQKAFSDSAAGLKEVEQGKYLFDDVRGMFEASLDAIKQQGPGIETAINEVTANNGQDTTQTSIDLAGELLRNFTSAEDAIEKIRKFNENRALNERLTGLAEEQKLRAAHEEAAFNAIISKIVASAKAEDLKNNEARYFQEAYWAQQEAFINEQNALTASRIKAEADLAYTRANRDDLIAQEEQKLKTAHAKAAFEAAKTHIALIAKANNLEHNRELYAHEEYRALNLAFLEEQNKLTAEEIRAETGRNFVANNEKRLLEQEAHKLRIGHIEAEHDAMQALIAAQAKADDIEENRAKYLAEAEQKLKEGHANKLNDLNLAIIANEAKANDLEHNRKLYAQEEDRALTLAFLEEQNRLTAEERQAEAKLNFIINNEKQLHEQEAHKLRIGHINAEHDAMQALVTAQAKADDIKENRDKYLAEAEQKLKEGHANKLNELELAAIANEAKANDLRDNRAAYEIEARIARENAFYDERNRLEEDRIKAEEEIAWNSAHRKDLLEQENQKVRLEYLAEYQKLQLDGANHLTENMTKEQFIALKEQTKAAEDSIARREKASAASEKALATLRGKGTKEEKKALLDAQIKQRAAEKDWTGTKFEIKDTDSDAEIARKKKAQENAVKAEMAINAAMSAVANLAQQLNAQTDKIGAKQAPIDTRLQGSKVNDKILGSYWKQLARDMNKIGAVNPYFTQDDFANNIEALVNKGISFDIKQRAFLMTIQEKIANTFDVADGTLLRLVRIQQQDTTAGRLGMESALNSFLNSMYETSEYLSDVASSVRSSLGEMQALMEGAAATELEFQVQKWMGSLYSVGMSQDAVQSIAQTFGQIASGDVGGLTGSGTGNLLIMAANEAGMSIADILQDGLDADETNTLMQAMVNYLAEIAETSSDSRVVQQQLANVYGVKASDLKAATNLASSLKDVSKQDLTYSGMLGQLNKMANSMILRTSTGEMLTNVWDNVQYTMATQMANDPILYLLPRVATLLEDYAGGIDLPFLNVMGFGVDLNTSVAQLMNVAAMSGSILGALGPMISGLASAASGSVMLSTAGINTSGKAPVIARGSAQPLQHLSGSSLSESGYVGNASGDDVKNATLQDAEDSKKKQMVEAKDEENAEDVSTKADLAVVNIYNLLEEVAHGSQSLRVRIINNGTNGSVGSSGSGNTIIGGGAGAGSTGAMGGVSLANKVNEGNDNGNWVLAF